MTNNARTDNNNLWSSGGPGFSSKTDNWATPPEVFAALDNEFHFTLDACASAENAKCERYFTVKENGLTQPWAPETTWLNPPYGETIGNWLRKAADEADAGATVVCLIPARTDTRWWHDQVMARASEVRFVKGRLKFGGSASAAPFPSALVIYRPSGEPLQVSTWTRPVPPARPAPLATKRSQRRRPRRSGVLAGTTSAHATRSATQKTAAKEPLAIAIAHSQNSKLGQVATTYAAQTSCPDACVFKDGGGCYAESGKVGMVTKRLNIAAKTQPAGPVKVAIAEARAIDGLNAPAGHPLRLHTVGDCKTDRAAQIVSAASARYRKRAGRVWTYTHAWRDVSRESWGDVSVLASCETAEDVREAKKRGYATAIVVDQIDRPGRQRLPHSAGRAAGVEILPCPQQTHGTTCSKCRLCFKDKELLLEEGYSIAFAVHGGGATIRAAKKALDTPGDPRRRFSTRQLIPLVIAELEAKGQPTTNAAIASLIGCNSSSVAQMRQRLAAEAAAAHDTARGTGRRTTRSSVDRDTKTSQSLRKPAG